ncbi:MAG: methyltransferase [Candidatus Pacearchaeota archaeon]|jgi:predicted nicotinamide N-methyase
MELTKAQKEQVERQLRQHNRNDVKAKLTIKEGEDFELIIKRGVFGSDFMSSGMYLVRFLYHHQDLFSNKLCLDMGCGSGIQGLVMARYGAKHVDLADINKKAVENTKENIKLHNLQKKTKAYVSDLFTNLPKDKKYEVILFNHPFYSEEAENFGKEFFDDVILRKSMLGGTELIKRFFREVKSHLKDKNSLIIMPYFHFAGKENDPARHVKDYDLYVFNEERIKSNQGIQLGEISMYVIKQKN